MDYAINMVGVITEAKSNWDGTCTLWELGFVPDFSANEVVITSDGSPTDDFSVDSNKIQFNTAPVTYTEITEFLPSGIGINQASQISFTSGKSPLGVSGIKKLEQMVIKLLLTNTGEDIVDPAIGGNLRRMAAENPEYLQSETGIVALATEAGNRVSGIIKYYQEDIVNSDERLALLTVRDAYLDYDNNVAVIAYGITAESGAVAVLSLTQGGL